jgi:hypothetical protein
LGCEDICLTINALELAKMDFDREANNQLSLREEREDAFSSEPIPTQYSLRSLLMLAVPVAILSLAYRWLLEHTHLHIVWGAGLMGAITSVTMTIMLGGFSYVLGRKDVNDRFLRIWFWYCLLAVFYGGLGWACLIAVLCWISKMLSWGV